MRISIRKKIILIFTAYMLAGGIIWLLNYYNSNLINHKLRIIEKKEDLLNVILEARRFEKNYFLTLNSEHLENAITFIHQAQKKLEEVIANDAAYTAATDLHDRLKNLGNYEHSLLHLLRVYQESNPLPQAPEKSAAVARDQQMIPVLGRKITEETEKMVKNERLTINRLIYDSKIYQFAALGGIFLLFVIAILFFMLNVNRPLKTLENAVSDIASGNYDNIPAIAAGVEFESLVGSLNNMIKMLNQRSEQLIQAKKLAALGTLTSGVAHELNNPLNNIYTSVQILLEELEDDDLTYKRELLTDAEKQVERARDIVRALLEFSRQRNFSVKPVLFKQLVEDTLKLIKGEIPANVTLVADIPDEICGEIDSRRIQQVLLNLILNALHAIENGGKITIKAFPHNPREFCFQVRDTGKGIPEAYISKIFDPFFSTKEISSDTKGQMRTYEGILDQEGTGLGLAICHGIVQKHNGRIEAESKLNEGTTFTVYLPVGVCDAATV